MDDLFIVDDYDHNSDKHLVLSVFKQAVSDIIKRPHADPYLKYKKDSLNHFSADAKRFIDQNNKQFEYLCGLVFYDPEWMQDILINYISSKVKKREGNHAVQSMQLS